MTRRIDAFSHVLPKRFFDEMAAQYPRDELLNFEDSRFWDVDKRLADLETYGVDRQVVMLARPPVWVGMDPGDALPLVRLANDEVRRIADEHPETFVPVATLPFLAGEYVDELRRCIDDLGMAGVQILSHTDGAPIDSPEYEEFYATVDELDVPIWIHPQSYELFPWIDEYDVQKILGWPFATTVALTRLVMSGVLDRYDLDVVAHHMGGMIPHYHARIESFYAARVEDPQMFPDLEWYDLSDPVMSYFRDIYADTSVGASPSSFRSGFEFFGAERLVFGTDYPFGPNAGEAFLDRGIALVENADLPERARDRIFAGNAVELLDL